VCSSDLKAYKIAPEHHRLRARKIQNKQGQSIRDLEGSLRIELRMWLDPNGELKSDKWFRDVLDKVVREALLNSLRNDRLRQRLSEVVGDNIEHILELGERLLCQEEYSRHDGERRPVMSTKPVNGRQGGTSFHGSGVNGGNTNNNKPNSSASSIKCYHCREMGHRQMECPKKKEKDGTAGGDTKSKMQRVSDGMKWKRRTSTVKLMEKRILDWLTVVQ